MKPQDSLIGRVNRADYEKLEAENRELQEKLAVFEARERDLEGMLAAAEKLVREGLFGPEPQKYERGVVEQADTTDLKSVATSRRAGSTPAAPTEPPAPDLAALQDRAWKALNLLPGEVNATVLLDSLRDYFLACVKAAAE